MIRPTDAIDNRRSPYNLTLYYKAYTSKHFPPQNVAVAFFDQVRAYDDDDDDDPSLPNESLLNSLLALAPSLHIYSLLSHSFPHTLSSTAAVRNSKSLLGRLCFFTNGLSLPRRRGFRDFHWGRGAGWFVAAVVEVAFACCVRDHLSVMNVHHLG